jgi:uncharacterized repeat protein (TIGR01451 family)
VHATRRLALSLLSFLTLLVIAPLHASTLTWESHSTAAQSHYTLRQRGPAIVLVDDTTGRVLASAPVSETSHVVIRGAGGAHDDTLTVDVSDRLRLAGGIDYDGGAGGFDTLVLTGGSREAQKVTQLSPNAGTIDVAGITIRYDDLEPLTDTSAAVNFFFTATAGGEEINVVDGPVVGGTTQTTEINSGMSGTFELLDFANKTNVTIDTGGGSDIVTVNNPNPAAGMATMTINGGAAAETFRITPSATIPYTVTGGAPLPPGTGDILIVPLGGTTGQALSIASDANGLQGQFTFGNRQPVTFSQVETINPSDLFVTKSGAGTVDAGGNMVYTITVQNVGSNDAANISLTDNLTGSTFVSIMQTVGPTFNCTTPAPGATGTVTCTSPVLLAGTSATFGLTVRANPNLPAGSTLSNTASATSGTSEIAPSDNSATSNATVTVSADVAVTKLGPTTVAPSTPLPYTITVMNNGPSDAASVTLTDTVPAGTTFSSFAQNSGPTFSCTTPSPSATGTVNCSIATLASGATATFTLTVGTNPAIPPTITNTATVATTTTDPTPGNNSSTANTNAMVAADLAITKTPGAPSVTPGGTITYTIGVTNNGPSAATNVTITDALPAGTTFVSAIPSQGTCAGTTTVICSAGSLGSGGSMTITLAVTAPSSGPVINNATVSATETDLVPMNNTATSTVTVTSAPVPTLSEWMLYCLAAGLMLIAMLKLR